MGKRNFKDMINEDVYLVKPYVFSSLALYARCILKVNFGLEEQCSVREDNIPFNFPDDLFLYSGQIGSWSSEHIFIFNESLNLL